MYATVADLRAEGVTTATASDERLEALIDEATRWVDHLTGWFFEPRTLTLRLDGRGLPTIELPVPPLQLDGLFVDDVELSRDPADLLVVGAPVTPGFSGPRLTLSRARVFPKGKGNVRAEGLWGYTEDDGTATGRTPLAIRRACMMLVLRNLAPLADDAAIEARSRWRVIEERTRDQSYKLDPHGGAVAAAFTGDPDIDVLLRPYVRPRPLGAV